MQARRGEVVAGLKEAEVVLKGGPGLVFGWEGEEERVLERLLGREEGVEGGELGARDGGAVGRGR